MLVRDAVSRDACHHSFTWDLSQNVTRAPFRAATIGVSGCVTPGGELFLPHKGRTVMGREKLSLQGIPADRLQIDHLSEVQQSDLAGNAMSVSVVCATMLAAICAPELRRARKKNKRVNLTDFVLSQKYDDANGAILGERGDLYNAMKESGVPTFMDAFEGVAKDLARDAFRSSVLCTCESSGTCSDDPKMLECSGCGMGVCGNCYDRYNMKPHCTKVIDVAGEGGRPDQHEFDRRLRAAVPSTLRLGEDWKKVVKDAEALEAYSFQLQKLERKRRHYTLTYGAWEDYGSGRQVAEIRVNIGKLGALDPDYGVAARFRSFGPAIRNTKPLRGTLKDEARLIYKVNANKPATWEVPDKPTEATLQVVGSDPGPSQRVLCGINDVAAEELKKKKLQKAYMAPFQSRNSTSAYHPKWKTFPGTIEVSGDSSNRVNGTYRRLSCQQTVVHSALWRREATDDEPTMYIYIRPDVLRSALDVAVISPTPCYRDGMEVCELHDWIPENALVEKTHKTKATFFNWIQGPMGLQVEAPPQTMVMDKGQETFHDRVCAGKELVLCEMSGLSNEVTDVLLEHNEPGKAFLDLYGKKGTRNSKRLAIVAAPSLLKFAAEGRLPLDLTKWYRLPPSAEFGKCKIHVPVRPSETWRKIEGRKVDVERFYDEEKSIEYYKVSTATRKS